MSGGLTRRGALVALPALAVAACGGGGTAEAPADPNIDIGTQREGDVALLRQLLAAEPEPGGRAALGQSLGALGAKPEPGDAPPDERAAFEAAYSLYLDLIPKLSDGRLRELGAGLLAAKAARVARFRAAAGEVPVPEAFVT